MKKILFFFLFALCVHRISAQAPEIDSLRKLLQATIPDTTRVEIFRKLSFYGQSFQDGLDLAEKGLALAEKIKFDKGRVGCLRQIGNCYFSISNSSRALHFYLESLKIAERIMDINGIAKANQGIGYVSSDQGDYRNALSYQKKALLVQPGDKYSLALVYQDLGDCYLHLDIQDSALIFYQRSYEEFNSIIDRYQLNVTLNGLGAVQLKLGNTDLAMGYYKQALRNGIAYNDTVNLSFTNLAIARLFDAEGQQDSSIFYAQQSLFFAKANNVLKNVIASGKLLSKLYKENNTDRALGYLEVSQAASDSLFNREQAIQIQNMFFDETQREAALAEKAKEDSEDRTQNIAYALIALGIVTFIILFLLISRSVIVNEKIISFFGILGLLIVFEFINLFVHPFLEKITQHNLFLMLLILVVIASMLIPLHHRMEKWIKEKMVLKNKGIRLQKARKTIEELEEKVVDTWPDRPNE